MMRAGSIALLFAFALLARAQEPVRAWDVTDADIETDADRVPATKTGGHVLLKGARLLTVGPGGTIEGGSILVRDGKIAAVGKDLEAPAGVATIEAAGLTIMPGIID